MTHFLYLVSHGKSIRKAHFLAVSLSLFTILHDQTSIAAASAASPACNWSLIIWQALAQMHMWCVAAYMAFSFLEIWKETWRSLVRLVFFFLPLFPTATRNDRFVSFSYSFLRYLMMTILWFFPILLDVLEGQTSAVGGLFWALLVDLTSWHRFQLKSGRF